MIRKIRENWSRAIVRPLISMVFTRFLLALTAALLADFFIKSMAPVRQYAFALLAVLFIALAWIAYLRMDGVNLPKAFMKRVHIRKKPTRTYGDLIDHTDDEIESFDDLEDGEKDVCCLFADAICCGAFLLLSLIF